jgi:hypothetical protein
MKTLRIALGSFLLGAALSLAPIAAYAACDPYIWLQDGPDCHYYHMYALNGSNCDSEGCVCSYYRTSSVHYESGHCDQESGI